MDGTKTGRFYGDPHGQFVAALRAAGEAAGMDFSRPYKDLTQAERNVALYGTGGRVYDIVWSYKRGNRSGDFRFRGPWKGFAVLVAEEYARKHADHRGEAMRVLMKDDPCPDCGGKRLKPASLAVTYRGLDIAGLSALNVARSLAFFGNEGPSPLTDARAAAVTAALRGEISRRLGLIRDVGLGYLALDRAAATLSGGEAQRLRLAGLLGVKLTGVTFVLDEPTLGLHPRDTGKLVDLIRDLTAEGNTVVAVEHDLDIIRAADHVIDLGPGAGREGGRIVAEGPPVLIERSPGSVTGPYLAGRAERPGPLPGSPGPLIEIDGARANNLRGIDVAIPSGVLTAVTGVSGSGKTSLVFDVIRSLGRGRPAGLLLRDPRVGAFLQGRRGRDRGSGRKRFEHSSDHPRAFRYGPEPVRLVGRSPGPRFPEGPFFVPDARGPLRGLRRDRPEDLQPGSSGGRLRDVRDLPRRALQPRASSGSASPGGRSPTSSS